jgi:hypothetical protein
LVDARSCHGSARNRDVGRGGRNRSARSVVAVDEAGRKLGERTLGTTTADHLALLTWAEQFGAERRWAVEDCRHLSRRLERDLLGAGECLARVRTTPPRRRAARVRAALQHPPPAPIPAPAPTRSRCPAAFRAGIRVLRRDRLGGLVHEYLQVA